MTDKTENEKSHCGKTVLQQTFDEINNLDFPNGGINKIAAYTVIMPEDKWDLDTSFLYDKVNGNDFISICLKTLNVNSYTSYELGMVKIDNLEITDSFQSYIKPCKPISKALGKIIPDSLKAKIEVAPTFKDLWSRIEPLLSSQVIIGAETGKRRFTYLCNKYDIEMPIMAYIGWRGSEPWDLKRLHDTNKPFDTRSALDYAMEWAKNKIEDKH